MVGGKVFAPGCASRTGARRTQAEARTTGAKVHFVSLMDICHLKNAELEEKHQKYKGRVVLRGDIVKDNSGSYAVFTEQGSSASQMTAAKIMEIISRLPGCDGQAADAVSAYTQVKMGDAHKLLKIPKSECPDIWIRLPRHKWPKSWFDIEDPEVPPERNLYGHPLAGLLWERQFEEVLLELGWEKGPTTWKDMLKNEWIEIASWQTKRQSNCTRSQVLAWMITISRKRNLNQLEKCHKDAHRLS